MTNTIFITGRLTKDPEQRTTNQGKNITNFAIAESRGKDKTCYWDCTAWEATGDNIFKYLKKGDYIPVVGTIDYNEKEGKRYYTITVRQFDFPPKSKDQTASVAGDHLARPATNQYDQLPEINVNEIVTPF